MIYALDTNTLTFLLKEDAQVNYNANIATADGHELVLPRIVDYEVQRGLMARKMNKKLREYFQFRKTVTVGAIDEKVWDRAAYIYASLSQRGKIIDDADILIAAFCVENNYTLVTNNIRHFENIDGLRYIDWKDTD